VSEHLAHDAHLRAALRHAPDHALSPPAGLSQTILAAARKAHRPPRPAPAPPPVRMRAAGSGPLAWLQRLSSPRWAGALATGLVAALGLGLWLDLGHEPVIERPATPLTRDARSTPAANAVPPAEVVAPSAAATARDSSDAAKTASARSTLPPQRADGAATAGRDAVAEPSRGKLDDTHRSGQQDALATTQRRAAQTTAGAELKQRAATAAPASPMARSQPAAATEGGVEARLEPQPGPSTPVPEPAPAPPAALAKEQGPRAADVDRAVGPTTSPPASGELRATLAPRAARKAEADVPRAAPARALLQLAQAEIASGTARWTWTAPGRTDATPLDAAAQAWLERVAQQADGHWTDTADRGEPSAAIEVRWWRDGQLHATLRIEAEALRWLEPGGAVRRAALDGGTLQRLRSF